MNRDELVKKVSEILWANELDLSDGFDNYYNNDLEVNEAVNKIAEQIVSFIDASNKEQLSIDIRKLFCESMERGGVR